MNVNKELKTILQEYTSDDVLKQELIKNVVYKEADLLANATELLPTKNFNNLDFKWAFPDESLTGEYPVAEGASADLSQIDFVEFADYLQCAEVRFGITDEAKVRQLDNTTVDFSRRRASERLARLKNEEIVSALRAGARRTALGGSKSPRKDIITGMNTIFSGSNIPAMGGFKTLVPADKFGTLFDKVSGAVAVSIVDFVQEGFDIDFYPSREAELTSNNRALMTTYSDQTAFHGILDTNEIPLVEEEREGRMDLYTVRQYFKTKVVPKSTSVAKSARIVTLDTSSW